MKPYNKYYFFIDLIGLGGGFLLCAGYYYYKYCYPIADGPLFDLWPNIGTEVLGVWISVRIIDAMINRRDERSRTRKEIIGHLNFITILCRRLIPDLDNQIFDELLKELNWHDTLKNHRESRLTSTEKTEVAKALSHASLFHKKALKLKKEISETLKMLKLHRSIAEIDDLEEAFKTFIVNFTEHQQLYNIVKILKKECIGSEIKLSKLIFNCADMVEQTIEHAKSVVNEYNNLNISSQKAVNLILKNEI